MTEMGKQVHTLTHELRTDKIDLSTQMNELMDVMREQTAHKRQHQPQMGGNSSQSNSINIPPATPILHSIPHIPFGGNVSQKVSIPNPPHHFPTVSSPQHFPHLQSFIPTTHHQ